MQFLLVSLINNGSYFRFEISFLILQPSENRWSYSNFQSGYEFMKKDYPNVYHKNFLTEIKIIRFYCIGS